MAKQFLFSLILFFYSFSNAQSFRISGKIVDARDNSPLIGVNVLLSRVSDTMPLTGTSTDLDGYYFIENVPPSAYVLNITYVSYKTINKNISVSDSTDLGTIKMEEEGKLLKEVVIQDKQLRAQQLTDTTQYNAGSFKSSKDANVEDLITKMPGVTSDNGTVKVNGEQVKKILVDGKEFFGDDPNIALKNLPAEVIDKVQVFDKLSDQAQLTGFDDGNTQKTINIITKKGMNNGTFGKIYGGYGGPGNRYLAGGNINIFKNDRRFSIIGMSNNVNQQNFNSQDLLGITGGGSTNRNSRGGGGFQGGGSKGGSYGGRGDNSLNNFLVGQQSGIATTHSIGVNYSDLLGAAKKVKFTGSYFFNASKNVNDNDLSRNYITSLDSGSVYNEQSNSVSTNYNHRVNLRVEYSIDSFNTLIFTPRIGYQQNKSNNNIFANSYINGDSLLSETRNTTGTSQHAFNFSNDLLYQHKFQKKGRSLSVNFSASLNNKTGNQNLYSLTQYFTTGDSSLLNQQSDRNTKSYTLSGNISYTEPVRKNGLLQFSYNPSYTKGNTDVSTYDFDIPANDYTVFDTALSNRFNNTYLVNKGGASYRYNKEKINFMAGINFQHSLLRSDQSIPFDVNLHKNFYSVLPQAMFNYKFSKEKNLRIMYRTATSPPSINQLQGVIDNSNPLQLTSGNPDLRQNYTHTLSANYGQTNPKKATNLFLFIYGSYTENYVANATFQPAADSLLDGNILLSRGSQLTKPVNLNGNWNFRTFLTYGLPVSKLKSNFNINGGFTYARTPGLINSDKNFSNSFSMNAGAVLSSNISDKIDFTISYSANYNIVKNTLQQGSNNNYFNHSASAKFNWQFWKGFVFNTNINNTLYAGISSSYNTSFWLWNASLAYKFLKNENLEVKFSVNDILSQNKNVSRNVTETYIEDVRYTTLQRYFMGTVTYTIRKFGKAEADNKDRFIPDQPAQNDTLQRISPANRKGMNGSRNIPQNSDSLISPGRVDSFGMKRIFQDSVKQTDTLHQTTPVINSFPGKKWINPSNRLQNNDSLPQRKLYNGTNIPVPPNDSIPSVTPIDILRRGTNDSIPTKQ